LCRRRCPVRAGAAWGGGSDAGSAAVARASGLDALGRRRHNRRDIPHAPEVAMSIAADKPPALRAAPPFNPRCEAVTDAAFTAGSPFFDPRDSVQVKYEMLRRVHVEGWSVSRAAATFGFSRSSFYAVRAARERAGLLGLLPGRPGPRGGH